MYQRAKHHVKRAYRAVFGSNEENDQKDNSDDEQRHIVKSRRVQKRERALQRKAQREQNSQEDSADEDVNGTRKNV